MRTLLVGTLALAVSMAPIASREQAAMPTAARAALDSFLDMAVEREFTPGFGMAIVQNGRVIYQRSVGWADREAKRRVDADTIFYIASCTKAFTSLATVLLDRDGVLKLDATLAGILPEARLADGLDASKITVRQLLTHTHGIAGDGPLSYRAAYSGEIDRAAMIRALPAHKPAPTGTAFAYSNVGYNILSLAIDRLAEKPWQDVLADRVFRPLGLASTSARVSSLPAGRLAMPYRPEAEGLARLPYAKTDANMQAAGGIVSTIGDLARFVTAVMDAGVVDGRRVFPADAIARTQRVHATMSTRFGDIEGRGYALGWNVGTLDGETLVFHGGGFPGFSAHMSFIPSRRLGVVVAGNGAFSAGVQDIATGYALALHTGKDAAVARYKNRIAEMPARVAEQRKAIAADRARRAARPQATALPLSAYVGRYADAVFGTLDVTLRDGRIHVRNGVLESTAEVFDGAKHALRVELTPGSGSVVIFVVADGKVTGASYSGYSLQRVR